MAGKALIVLETPWWTPEINRGRASVLPFFQGLVNFVEHFAVYHSNFYEREGFKVALLDDLTHTREDRLYLYIAAHGLSSMIGGMGNCSGVTLTTVLADIGDVTRYKNIEGVIIGSCTIGGNVNKFKQALIGTRIPWIFGYTCEIDWITSTLIDLAIFENMTTLKPADLSDRTKIIKAFARSLKRFDGNFIIGKKAGRNVALKNAMTLVVKPRGSGNVAQDNTPARIQLLGW